MPTESRKPKKPAGKRRKPRRRPVRLLMAAAIPASVLAAVALLILAVASWRVGARFEAREHESPTRIYGRAVRLADGALLGQDDLLERLNRLGYRRGRSDRLAPGEYRLDRGVTIALRSFEGPDGEVPGRVVSLRCRGNRIERLTDAATGRDLDQAFLEPEVLTTLYGPMQEDRIVLELPAFPASLVDAVLVTEDRNFYHHFGLDPTGMARATLTNVKAGEIRQGGSTLTQQLAKNLFFDQDRTWSRKIGEAIVALILESRYSKDRILAAYLNEVYLGQRGAVSIRGFAEAARFYFGKDVRNLDLAEAATLAGLIRAPGVYNPFLHADRAVERRNQVLAAMIEAGKITAAEGAAAKTRPMKLRKDRDGGGAPSRGLAYLADLVRGMIAGETDVDFTRAGMRVFTTVDPAYQSVAETALERGLQSLERGYRALRRGSGPDKLQGAMVVIDPADGSIRAMVGGRDYAVSQFNRITQAHRQPGSLFKPFVYLAGYRKADEGGRGAADEAFTPATRIEDEPLQMKVGDKLWAPANYDNTYRGVVTAQMALEQSLNVPTVRAARAIGLDAVVDTAERAGIDSPLKPYPSLALGAQEVTPLEIATAYATLADDGVRHRPVLVEAIVDGAGNTIYRGHREAKRVLPAAPTYLVTVGLQGAIDRGTAASSRSMGFTGTAAGKTGTTDDFRDAWFSGYTPDLLALVWVGFDNGDTLRLPGSRAALPIWVDFMKRSGAETDETFTEPDGIVWEKIDPTTGGRARWSCPETEWMAFLEGVEPEDRCPIHGWFTRWWSRDVEPTVE